MANKKEQITPSVILDGNDVYVVFKNASKELQEQIKGMFSTDLVKQLQTLVPIEDDTDAIIEKARAVVAPEPAKEERAELIAEGPATEVMDSVVSEVSSWDDEPGSIDENTANIVSNETTEEVFTKDTAVSISKMTGNEALLWLYDHINLQFSDVNPEFLRSLLVAFQTARGNDKSVIGCFKLSTSDVVNGFSKNGMQEKIVEFLKENNELATGLAEARETFGPTEESLSADWD